MIHLRVRRPHNQIPRLPDPQTQIHVIKRHRVVHVQPADLLPHVLPHQHARRRHRREVLRNRQPAHISSASPGRVLVRVPGHAAHADDNPRVLHRVVRIVQQCADRAHVLPLGKHQHLLHPVRRDHLDVVVQQQQVLALRRLCPEVVDRGIVEFLPRLVCHHPDPPVPLQLPVVFKRLQIPAVVLDDDDLPVAVCTLFPDGVNALPQVAHVVHVRDHDADQRLPLDRVLNLIGGNQRRVLDLSLQPAPLQVLPQRRPRRRHRIRFRRDVRRRAVRVAPPVVQHHRHVHDLLRLLRQPQNQVVVLASLKPFPEAAPGLFHQFPAERREVAYIVVASQRVRAEVRLVVRKIGILRALLEFVFI